MVQGASGQKVVKDIRWRFDMHRILVFSACPLLLVLLLGGAASTRGAGTAGADLAKGKQIFTLFCVTCHGENGDGKGIVGVTLDPLPRDFTKAEFKYCGACTDDDLFQVISNGAASQGGSPLMAPWGAVIPEGDRWAVLKYIRAFKK
jgi:mono/diheme cytochrome c family protein